MNWKASKMPKLVYRTFLLHFTGLPKLSHEMEGRYGIPNHPFTWKAGYSLFKPGYITLADI